MNLDLEEHFAKEDREHAEIYFRTYVREDRIRNLSFILIEKRNKALIALFFHVISSLAGFSFYFIRKNKLYLFINSLSLLLAFAGIYGVLTMSNGFTLTHGILTSAILGSCFLYSLLEAIFGSSEPGENMQESHIIILLALPYLIDFGVGLYTMLFATAVLDQNARLKKQKKEQTEEELGKAYHMEEISGNGNLCAICLEKERDCIFYKCGHKVACYVCGTTIQRRVNVCPICRGKITDVIRVFT